MKITQPRILIVDDNPEIHADFRKVLAAEQCAEALADLEASLFGETEESAVCYTLDSAFQGASAIDMVQKAAARGEPYGLAFVDVRMPPGIDGVCTVAAIRQVDAALPCVMCTAYSDYTPEAARQKIGIASGLLFISKPFDPKIIRALAGEMMTRFSEASIG